MTTQVIFKTNINHEKWKLNKKRFAEMDMHLVRNYHLVTQSILQTSI